ncbi:PREDICTED: protein YLS9-like [Nelumbo nucifera]|uniref:Protein YLS9-like n=1 Tax=Nelumbo nucifera TaxID=4432 RepID=A0A1U7Z6K0_NELNU|nr:PREDICTED: protein YLS9-like [Nelumbo nucifera]
MADRVHPRDSPPMDRTAQQAPEKPESPPKLPLSVPEKPVPPPGTYVVQIPKDQIYRVPPPENDRKYKLYSQRKNRRNRCCCCFCWSLGLLALLIFLIAIAAGVFYLVVRPKIPSYSVEDVSIKGFNLTLTDPTISPVFNVTVRAENPNKKIGIYYETGSYVAVSYTDVKLCNGALPAFFQPSKNVTVFATELKGSDLRLSSQVHATLTQEQKLGKIPLGLYLKVPVRVKVGSVKTWTITVKVHCDITVNKLSVDAAVLSKSCDARLKPWKD